ncbi:hypothetical protein P8Q88_05315 [Qipengyuania sp. XHP0207]|uniref:hypothetical protein n=1 Tax=Qipengyuania sp. XHP0207 TaxID=3038078 RepID=UPI00241BF7EC|nr:hypothetical protein [Qipengyuania sp. XHP0207]MDG5747594.1 hypothetical protein [Qipengyuania sp. XHP0207]
MGKQAANFGSTVPDRWIPGFLPVAQGRQIVGRGRSCVYCKVQVLAEGERGDNLPTLLESEIGRDLINAFGHQTVQADFPWVIKSDLASDALNRLEDIQQCRFHCLSVGCKGGIVGAMTGYSERKVRLPIRKGVLNHVFCVPPPAPHSVRFS